MYTSIQIFERLNVINLHNTLLTNYRDILATLYTLHVCTDGNYDYIMVLLITHTYVGNNILNISIINHPCGGATSDDT